MNYSVGEERLLLEPAHPSPIHRSTSSSSDDLWTSPELMAIVQHPLGKISFDLASCEAANQTIQADFYFDKSNRFQTGHHLVRWTTGFWCHPPASQVEEFAAIVATKAIKGAMLCPAHTDWGWWQGLLLSSDFTVFLSSPIRFIDPASGRQCRNTEAYSLFVWGLRPSWFWELGTIVEAHCGS